MFKISINRLICLINCSVFGLIVTNIDYYAQKAKQLCHIFKFNLNIKLLIHIQYMQLHHNYTNISTILANYNKKIK